jgi:maleate isomerase
MTDATTLAKPDSTLIVDRKHLPFALDRGICHRAAIGLIVLATDNTIEYEWRRMIGGLDGVGFYESRIYNSTSITPETLAAMEKDVAGGAALIKPGERLDVIAFGCTSGTIVIGEDKLFARIREARPGIACTTPITAAIAGFKALGARRIALLTPYVDSINQMMRRFIVERGIDVPVVGSYNHENDNEVARIDAASVRAAVLDLGRHSGVDGVFVSCTSIRVAELVEPLERDLGKPVTSSNHAMAWHSLRLAGYADPVAGWGRLLRA